MSCREGDSECIQKPLTYTFHFITMVSNLTNANAPTSLFIMTGPKWSSTNVEFDLVLDKVMTKNCWMNEQVKKYIHTFFNDLETFNLLKGVKDGEIVEMRKTCIAWSSFLRLKRIQHWSTSTIYAWSLILSYITLCLVC